MLNLMGWLYQLVPVWEMQIGAKKNIVIKITISGI